MQQASSTCRAAKDLQRGRQAAFFCPPLIQNQKGANNAPFSHALLLVVTELVPHELPLLEGSKMEAPYDSFIMSLLFQLKPGLP